MKKMIVLLVLLASGCGNDATLALDPISTPPLPYAWIDKDRANTLYCEPVPDAVFQWDYNADGVLDDVCSWECAVPPTPWYPPPSNTWGPGLVTLAALRDSTGRFIGWSGEYRPGCHHGSE